MTTLLFTISVSAQYRGTQEIYSAQANACNGEKLYHLAEAARSRQYGVNDKVGPKSLLNMGGLEAAFRGNPYRLLI